MKAILSSIVELFFAIKSLVMKLTTGHKSLLIIFAVLFIDQAVKIWIKTHMQLHESIEVTKWFYIYFTENNGMAFGMELFSKIFLSLFRIVAVGFIGYYLFGIVKRHLKPGYIYCIALILAGASGNIFDSLFYGLIFDHSWGQVSELFPIGGGYAPVFYGKVVDMLYFPLIQTTLPDWLPIWGGEDFVFFRPIFNIADAAISVGVVILILFYNKQLNEETSKPKKHEDA